MRKRNQVHRRLIRGRMPLYHPRVPLVLLWSEKCGCTTAVKWFFFQAGLLEEALEHSHWVHDYERDVLKSRDGYVDELIAALHSGIPAIKVVRDPFRRAVSSFLTLSDKKEDDPVHFSVGVRRRIRQHFYGSSDAPYSFSFEQFLQWMTTIDTDELNGHIAPQTLALERTIPDLEALKLEQFECGIRALESRFALPEADLASMSESSHHVSKFAMPGADPEAVSRIHFTIPRHPRLPVPAANAFYSPATIDLVTRVYHEDFTRFGYATVLDR